ncbi:MAG: adenylosuccinate lyase [Roseicyclus sp.]|nr:adenylosuccinate lyase [Roseicyclus sp.]
MAPIVRRSMKGTGAIAMRANKFSKAADLVSGMADRDGFDLNDPAAAKQFRNMVMKCRGCTDPEACTQLLAENEHLDAPPEYCRNKDRLTR